MQINLPTRLSFVDFVKEKFLLLVFVLYIILLAVSVAHHEPWMDEAQAWLLAKDSNVPDLLIHFLRYEGSPGLWHLILMIPAKLGWPYFSINIISALFASFGVALFLRYSPFPTFIKILYPFTFFVFFQYGVIARNYCLISPILFLIAIVYPEKNDRPYTFILLLCVLANISAHTFLIAGSIALVHFVDLIKIWRSIDKKIRLHQMIALAFFGLVALAVIWMIKTPPDQIYAGYINLDLLNFWLVSKRMLGGSLMMNEYSHLPFLFGTITTLIFILSLIWFWRNNSFLLYLLPLILISILFSIKYKNLWHQGVLFLLWMFVLWISFEKHRSEVPEGMAKKMVGAIAVVFLVQIYWCIYSVNYDINHNYSASYSVSKYIKANQLDKENIFISGWKNISILPYFSTNIFYNHNNGSNKRFWNWSINNVTSVGASEDVLDTIICLQPGVVIFSSDHIARKQEIELPGYKAVAFFKGYLCWKTGLSEPECYLIFRKKQDDDEIEKITDKPAKN